jgi:hypothetical protein
MVYKALINRDRNKGYKFVVPVYKQPPMKNTKEICLVCLGLSWHGWRPTIKTIEVEEKGAIYVRHRASSDKHIRKEQIGVIDSMFNNTNGTFHYHMYVFPENKDAALQELKQHILEKVQTQHDNLTKCLQHATTNITLQDTPA